MSGGNDSRDGAGRPARLEHNKRQQGKTESSRGQGAVIWLCTSRSSMPHPPNNSLLFPNGAAASLLFVFSSSFSCSSVVVVFLTCCRLVVWLSCFDKSRGPFENEQLQQRVQSPRTWGRSSCRAAITPWEAGARATPAGAGWELHSPRQALRALRTRTAAVGKGWKDLAVLL